jgi:trypsin
MNGIAAGWGRLSENGSASYTLQQIQLPIISKSNQFCIQQISDDILQFCAGFIQGGRDTCQGDR